MTENVLKTAGSIIVFQTWKEQPQTFYRDLALLENGCNYSSSEK